MPANEPALLTNNPMVGDFYDNTQSNVIRITDDKLKVILMENKQSLSGSTDFLAPTTLLLSLILTYCTTDFREFLKVSAAVWQGFYFFLTLGTIAWLVIVLRKIKQSISVDQLIELVRKQKQPTSVTVILPLVIHNASYAAGATSVDVTNQVRHMISNNTFEIPASNALAGDPGPGLQKTLTINCSISGEPKTFSAIEGSSIKLQ